MNKAVKIATLMVLSVLLGSWRTIDNYWTMNCSQFVNEVDHQHGMVAADYFNLKNDLKLVQQTEDFSKVDSSTLKYGDVAAFHGMHVAWWDGKNWMDSDYKHDGPGRMQYNPKDGWFMGTVRIVRF